MNCIFVERKKPLEKDKCFGFATDKNHSTKMKKKSSYIGHTVQELFEKHFENTPEALVAKREVRYK